MTDRPLTIAEVAWRLRVSVRADGPEADRERLIAAARAHADDVRAYLAVQVSAVTPTATDADRVAWIRLHEILSDAVLDTHIAASAPVRAMVTYLRDAIASRPAGVIGAAASPFPEAETAGRRMRAAGPRKAVTGAELRAFEEAFVRKHGSARGWRTAAAIEFGISPDTLSRRLNSA